MPWSGGIYSRGYPSWTSDASNNLPLSATKFDTEDNDFATGLNNCLTKDGTSKPSATLNWAQQLNLTAGSDTTVFSVGRTGGSNNPVLSFAVADATGVTMSSAGGLTFSLPLVSFAAGTELQAVDSGGGSVTIIGGSLALAPPSGSVSGLNIANGSSSAGSSFASIGSHYTQTGSATPSLGTAKPGSNSSPATWLTVKYNSGSNTGYIPIWS